FASHHESIGLDGTGIHEHARNDARDAQERASFPAPHEREHHFMARAKTARPAETGPSELLWQRTRRDRVRNGYNRPAENVSQGAGSPRSWPRSNQRTRSSEEPCVHFSGCTVPVACRCRRSSPTAAAARMAESMSPGSSSPRRSAELAQTPA